MRLHRSATLVLFLFTIVFDNVCATDMMTTNLSTLAYDICANNEFCNAGLDPVPAGRYSCCKPCSCQEDCNVGQQCCPDSELRNDGNFSLTCKHMNEHFNWNREISDRLGVADANYYVIDHCRENFHDDDVIEGCLSPRTLAEHVFVTDPVSTLIYKNYQCALCNGVHSYELWELRITCAYGDEIYSVLEQERFILTHCSFYSEPKPSSVSLNYRWRCYPGQIDTCNVTGEWANHNDDLVHACAVYNIPYMEELFDPITGWMTGSQKYKNVFCYLCNKKENSLANSICNTPFEISEEKNLLMIPYVALISNVFEVSDQHEESAVERKSLCQANEMFDPLMGCMAMLCPIGLVPLDGKCLKLMETLNTAVAAVFEYDISPLNDTDTLYKPDSDDPIYGSMVAKFKEYFDRSNCPACTIEVFSSIVYLQGRSSNVCPFLKVSKLFEYITKGSSLRIANDNGRFEVRIRLSTKYSQTEVHNRINLRYLLPIRKQSVSNCMSAILLNPKFYCKRVQFTLDGLADSGRVSNATLTRLLSSAEPDLFEDGNAVRYVICVDAFVDIVHTSSNTGTNCCQIAVLLYCTILLAFHSVL